MAASLIRSWGFGGRSEPPNGVQGRSPEKILEFPVPETPGKRISTMCWGDTERQLRGQKHKDSCSTCVWINISHQPLINKRNWLSSHGLELFTSIWICAARKNTHKYKPRSKINFYQKQFFFGCTSTSPVIRLGNLSRVNHFTDCTEKAATQQLLLSCATEARVVISEPPSSLLFLCCFIELHRTYSLCFNFKGNEIFSRETQRSWCLIVP